MTSVLPIIYKVKGPIDKGFPIDVLRQDQAFPADYASAAAIQRIVSRDGRLHAIYPVGDVEIALVSMSGDSPRYQLWWSHGWTIMQEPY